MSDTPETLADGSIESRPLPSVANLANSTTLKDIEKKRRVNKAIIVMLSTLATVALSLSVWAPWNFIIAAVLFIGATVLAFFTNALTPAELDDLLNKLSRAGDAAASKATQSKGGPQ